MTIEILTLQGELVKKVINNELRIKGYHTQDQWCGADMYGNQVNAGLYIARIITPFYKEYIKIMVIK